MSKTIPLGELALLKKVMGLTASDADGEALAAIRRANAIMKKHSVSWADFFERTVGVAGATISNLTDELRPSSETDLTTMIQNAFDELRGVDLGPFREFMDSIEKQFDKDKYLSPDQRKPLVNAVIRNRASRRRDE